uniref:Uncharacterized protein n=1 Tax=Panthera leo TaxID=9689 RepID=A0A8C8XDX5_PANLE
KPELKSFHFPYKSFLYCFTGSHLDSTLNFCRRHIYLLCPCKLCLQWLVIRYFNHLHKSKLHKKLDERKGKYVFPYITLLPIKSNKF